MTLNLGCPNVFCMSDTKSVHNPESLSLAQQNYVEMILDLSLVDGYARTSDLAARLGVSLPSVSEAVTRLVDQGIAFRNARHGIELTEQGRRVARQLRHRHDALLLFMMDVMAMERKPADAMACKIEHCVDKAFTDRLLMLADYLKQHHPETLEAVALHLHLQADNASPDWSQFSI